jgi:sodium-independent sulfate anion transporter 11
MHNIDTTGLVALTDLREDIERFGGKGMRLCFVGVNERVQERFSRFGWGLVKEGVDKKRGETRMFRDVEDAVFGRRTKSQIDDEIGPVEVLVVGNEKEKV